MKVSSDKSGTTLRCTARVLAQGVESSCLKDLSNLKQEFIPFFLNYLRDHTIHLIQSSACATPSPAKTPSLKKLQKSMKHTKGSASKRQQLFGASPAGDADELNILPTSVFSPNNSIDSPGFANINQKGDRSHGKQFRGQNCSQKASPQCGSGRSSHNQQTPESRSKQKISLGEFMVTPEQGNSSTIWRKKSPHSAGHKKEFSLEAMPSPAGNSGRRSGGKKRHSFSPLVQSSHQPNVSQAPVFCLNNSNDFPPMGGSGNKTSNNRRSLDSNIPPALTNNCDNLRATRVINFSNNYNSNGEVMAIGKFARDRLQEIRRTSPVTVQSNSGTRRITPTQVKGDNFVQQNSAFLVPIDENEKPLVIAFKVEKNQVTDTLHEERELLKKERERCHSQASESSQTSAPTPTKSLLEHSASVCEITEARLAEVTQQDRLDMLVSLYSKCLEGNLFPNVVVELYFLVQLLTARGGEVEQRYLYGNDLIEENYLATVHNTVYFAVACLDYHKRLLSMLDRCTLRLLLENPRVLTFSALLHAYLEQCYERAETRKGPLFPKSPIGSVSFQADTDNRKNFPSDKSFHLFRRQRDGFYELLREWEASRMNGSYNMSEMFGGRVRTLVGGKTELANLIHFARLFQSQLIAMCKGDGSIGSSEDDESIALLSQLKRTNPEKFKRLQERFIKPLSVGGPCPNPSFPGMQEFFRDFIIVACNPLLNQHLCDTFTAKVSELNETTFAMHDDEDAATGNGDEEEQDMFSSALLSVRLVSKFLGFVTFLPYQSPERIPDSMEATYIAIRNKHVPALNLQQCLVSAFSSGTLTLTVPWVVEYLSMMDPLAPRLDVFHSVLLLLLGIHRYMWTQLQDEMSFGNLLVTALISWLLENPVIPDGLFFSEVPDDVSVVLKNSMPSLASLDNRNFVDQAVFYICCPYIGELKTLLVDFSVGSNSKASTVRKITPISADIPVQKSLTDRQLQLQLEENFFHNHPASMKRVVDFVADRTASNFIKKFRSGLLQESITGGKERVLDQVLSNPEGSPSAKMKDRISLVALKVAQELSTNVKNDLVRDAPVYCHCKVPPLIALLLPDDQLESVVAIAASISEQLAGEKISMWINKHVTTGMYQSEIMPDIDKVTKTLMSACNEANSPLEQGEKSSASKDSQLKSGTVVSAMLHDDTLRHPSEVLIDFKDFLKQIYMGGRQISDSLVQKLLSETKLTLNGRQDVLPSVHKSFVQLTLELVLSLLVQGSPLYTPSLMEETCGLWQTVLHDVPTLGHIFSGRVVYLVHNAHDRQVAWVQYTDLLSMMFKAGLIQQQQFTESGGKFIPHIQDKDLIVRLVHCMCKLAEGTGEEEKADVLGTCLQLLYNQLPSNTCQEAQLILDTLGVAINNNQPFERWIEVKKED
ncbi:codanin-1-like isoform X2 [Dreissena polymorpha]|uniref:codanin-1-like isoform X2 n=1 Tax=Dreissena polymorpha TaxID=45954 RepID=UPI002263F0EC|nr:codanin-1-like isoform X2 [Dreissena polymorpha]